MSRFDYGDPGMDPERCDALSDPPPVEFDCCWCGNIEDDDTFWPYCSSSCATAADCQNEMEMQEAGRVASPAKG